MTSFEPTQVVVAAMDPVFVGPVVIVVFIIIAIVIAIVLLSYVLNVLGSRCPQCKRYNALHTTGGQFATGYTAYEERLCKHCGHREWKKVRFSGFPPGG